MNENIKSVQHSFKYDSGKIVVTGISNVENYDSKCVELRLSNGLLTIKGNDFNLEETDVKSGLIVISGVLSGLDYHARAEKTSIIKRLFK